VLLGRLFSRTARKFDSGPCSTAWVVIRVRLPGGARIGRRDGELQSGRRHRSGCGPDRPRWKRSKACGRNSGGKSGRDRGSQTRPPAARRCGRRQMAGNFHRAPRWCIPEGAVDQVAERLPQSARIGENRQLPGRLHAQSSVAASSCGGERACGRVQLAGHLYRFPAREGRALIGAGQQQQQILRQRDQPVGILPGRIGVSHSHSCHCVTLVPGECVSVGCRDWLP
jgi:hypothetical protein